MYVYKNQWNNNYKNIPNNFACKGDFKSVKSQFFLICKSIKEEDHTICSYRQSNK